MRLTHSFDYARPVAQHCPELVSRGLKPEHRAELVNSWRSVLARALTQRFATLFMGDRLVVHVNEEEALTDGEVYSRQSAPATHCLLRCGDSEFPALMSISIPMALALTDRSFGGDGLVPSEVPEELPRSAAILVEQLACAVAAAVALASEEEAGGEMIARSENAGRLKPFGAGARCLSFSIQLGPQGREPWVVQLYFAEAVLEAMLPGEGCGLTQPAKRDDTLSGNGAPFSCIPMPLEAVLSEFDLSIDQLDRLAPGDELPIAIAREIPLRIGLHEVGRGVLGTSEDRISIRVTRVTQQGSVR